MAESLEKLWTIEQVSDFLQIKTSVIKYWVQISEIPFVRLGKQFRFDPRDIRIWIEHRKRGIRERDALRKIE